jgi:hypothetical protein
MMCLHIGKQGSLLCQTRPNRLVEHGHFVLEKVRLRHWEYRALIDFD